MDSIKVYLLLFGLLLIIGLSVYALVLKRRVKQLEQVRSEQAEHLAQESRAQRDRTNKSIQIIASSVPEEKMSLTEAAMRLSVLLQSLDISVAEQEEFSAIFKLADATAHIPILEEWKKLPTKQKLALDQQRVAIEQEYREFIVENAKSLLGRSF